MYTFRVLVLILAACLDSIQASDYYGRLVGELNTLKHEVSGTVYVVDSTRLRIRHFNYDGKGPDTFFWLETKSSTAPTADGYKIPDENQRMEVLGEYRDADIVLMVPDNIDLADINWLSVWCRMAAVDFGSVKFTPNIVAPSARTVGCVESTAGRLGAYSGPVTILDTRTLRIERLRYDGRAPDGAFWVGRGNAVADIIPEQAHRIPDERGSLDRARHYYGETITLKLPGDLSVRDLGWLSLYCVQQRRNLGQVFFPAHLDVPPFIETKVAAANEGRVSDKSDSNSKANSQSSSEKKENQQVLWKSFTGRLCSAGYRYYCGK